MNYLPYLVFAVLLVGLYLVSTRARRRQAMARADLVDKLEAGTEVMTTSGLHGTVVARNDDGTVQLSIAPGVEVRWETAALRDRESLPERYRRADDDDTDDTVLDDDDVPDDDGVPDGLDTPSGTVHLGKDERPDGDRPGG